MFVLTTGVGWGKLPAELGCGSGVTCWRRLREWHEAGVWSRLHQAVLDRLGRQGLLDWSRTALDSVSVRAKRGGELTGPNPTDRGKSGSKYHLLVDAAGLPIAVAVTGANTYDSMLVEPILDGLPAVKGRGRDGLDGGRSSCTPTRATTTGESAAISPAATSPPVSPGGVSSRAADLAGTGGWSNVPWPGCSGSAASPCATTAPARPSPRSSPSPAR